MPLRRWFRVPLWTGVVLLVVVGVSTLILLTVPPPLERRLQGNILEALREHYQRNVQLESLRVTLVPEFRASGDNFVLPNLAGNLPPLIVAKHFIVRAGIHELLRKPVHLSWVKLDGLVINIPPKGSKPPQRSIPPASTPVARVERPLRIANFVIDQVDADGTVLYVLKKDPEREPMEFDILRLTLNSAGLGQPMQYRADLTNDTPPGVVHSTGSFGPWNLDEPASTGLSGRYAFDHADLSVFNGVSGILSSLGTFRGELNNIVVEGTTDTPDFQLDRGARQVHLTTQFHAVVDGTQGDTALQPVNARFLKSNLVATGKIASEHGRKGKTISLDVDVRNSRLEDLLALGGRNHRPAVTGDIDFQGHVTLPPGSDVVLKRLQMNGRFQVRQAHFDNEKMIRAIDELSRRAQGKTHDETIQNVPAEFAGNFLLQATVLDFSRLDFTIPGVAARMKGSYGLDSEVVDFAGEIRLKAPLSKVVGGAKGLALTPFDPIFMRHSAGTYLPLDVKGSRDHPQIGVQWKKLF